MPLFPVLLAVHVTLALALLVPTLVAPFVLRSGPRQHGTFAAGLLRLQGRSSLPISVGLAITGAALLVILGTSLLGRPWLLVALGLYVANLLVAGLVARPNLRRLLRIGQSDRSDAETWRRRARQQRRVAYGMAAVTGLIGFLMVAKPALW